MKRKLLSILLVSVLCLGLTPVMTYAATGFSDVPDTHWAYTAVMEMTDAGVINGVGGGKFAPNAKVSAWNVIAVSFPFPEFNEDDIVDEWVDGLFVVGILTRIQDQTLKISLSDSKIVLSSGESIPLSFLNGAYDITAANGPDDNGYWSYMFDFDKSKLPRPGISLNGAKFETTITIIDVPFMTGKAKADYFFEYQRVKIDQKVLIDAFLEQGVNVIRLPVTWTPFVDNETFEIDKAWLEAVKSAVDYILSKDAYCILNTHNDYLQRSYVGDHWERLWMYDEYKDYVDRRFTAIWTQIAEYFKNYPQKLIFEPFNEPTMEWYEGVPHDFSDKQSKRVNELNALFVDTVRKTGGRNKTRLLCLAVPEYNQYHQLSGMVLPDDDYLMVQVHSYSAMEIDPNMGATPANFDYKPNTDALFEAISAFTEKTGVPVIIGEMGVTHRESKAVLLPRVKYFFKQAAEHGVPCLWWQDFFIVESKIQFWLYNHETQEWGRPQILRTIKEAIKNAGSMQ